MDKWIMEFGRRIEFLRRELARMNQRDFAKALGLDSPNTVTRLERGSAGRINLEVLRDLLDTAVEAGMDANWLLLGREGKVEEHFARLASLSREELQVELFKLSQNENYINNFLRIVDDPRAKEALLNSFKSMTQKEKKP